MTPASLREGEISADDTPAPWVPEDAGVWAREIADILAHIPPPRARGVRCGRGWYPILAHSHRRITALLPGYELHQVKEKYGALRMRWQPPPAPGIARPVRPALAADKVAQAAWIQTHAQWQERNDAWATSPAGRAARAAYQDAVVQVESIIDEAEAASLRTCEDCGNPGRLRLTRAVSPWYRTVCRMCAGTRYITQEEWDAWWASRTEPDWTAERRDRWLHTCPTGTRLIASARDTWDLPGAVCLRQPDAVAPALASGVFREVLIAADPCGRAAHDALVARYAGHEPWRGGRTARAPEGAPTIIPLPGLAWRDLAPLVALGLERSWRYPGASVVYS